MGHGVPLERDLVTGELHSAAKDSSSPAGATAGEGAIRSRVTLVQVACTVTAPDGTQVRGLTQDNFSLFEDGAAQEIAPYLAAPVEVVDNLVLEGVLVLAGDA